MLLYIIRHGETAWNRNRRLQGSSDIPLTPEGEALAAETARGLAGIPFDFVFSSPLKRAYRTAELLRGDRDIPLFADSRLQEVRFGVAEGQADYRQVPPVSLFFSDPEAYVPPDGAESYGEILLRAGSFVREALYPFSRRHPGAAVLLVAHAAINRGLEAVLLRTPLADYWKDPRRVNCAVDILQLDGEDATMLAENQIYTK